MSSLTIGRLAFTFGYSASTGAVESMQTPEGNAISYGYDGSLLTSATWTGAVTGSVIWEYDNSFRMTSEMVGCQTARGAACQPMSYAFDNDDLLLSAGAFSLQRRADNGLLRGSTLEGGGMALQALPAGIMITPTVGVQSTTDAQGTPVTCPTCT